MDFEFVGSAKPCGRMVAHPPHVVGGYSTVRYGWLTKFCPGVGAQLTVLQFDPGCPEWPARYKALWSESLQACDE